MMTVSVLVDAFDTEEETTPLFEFARDAMTKLVPGSRADTWRLLSETTESEPYYFDESITRFGSEAVGIRVKARTEYYEGGGWTGSDYLLLIESYGLADEVTLRIDGSTRAVTFTIHGPQALAEEFEADFRARFGGKPSDRMLSNVMIVARSALNRHNWHGALGNAEIVLSHRAGDLEALLIAGIANAALGSHESAQAMLETVVARDPGNADGQYNLAMLHLAAGRLEDAEACLRASLAASKMNHAAAFQLGIVNEHLGRPKAALRAYKRAVRYSHNPNGSWGSQGLDFGYAATLSVRRLRERPNLRRRMRSGPIAGAASALSRRLAAARSFRVRR